MFQPHGDFEIKVYGRVILLSASGTWNLERSRELVMLWQEEIVPFFKDEPFAYSMDLNNWQLGGLDVFGEVARLQKWNWEHHMSRQAIVSPEGKLQSKLIRQLGRLMFDERTAYFSNMSDSIEWLSSQGFHIEDPEAEPDLFWTTVKGQN